MAEAQRLGLRVEGGTIQVVLVLGEGDLDELNPFGVRPGTREGDRLQALVPIGALCQIAATQIVETILGPSRPIPLQ